jgi:hypothetical protein
MRLLSKLIPISLMAALFYSAPAVADRAPTPDERAKIEAVLKVSGFTSWEEIEFDDGYWEVDDARGADGVEYDLKLDPKSFEIVRKHPD